MKLLPLLLLSLSCAPRSAWPERVHCKGSDLEYVPEVIEAAADRQEWRARLEQVGERRGYALTVCGLRELVNDLNKPAVLATDRDNPMRLHAIEFLENTGTKFE